MCKCMRCINSLDYEFTIDMLWSCTKEDCGKIMPPFKCRHDYLEHDYNTHNAGRFKELRFHFEEDSLNGFFSFGANTNHGQHNDGHNADINLQTAKIKAPDPFDTDWSLMSDSQVEERLSKRMMQMFTTSPRPDLGRSLSILRQHSAESLNDSDDLHESETHLTGSASPLLEHEYALYHRQIAEIFDNLCSQQVAEVSDGLDTVDDSSFQISEIKTTEAMRLYGTRFFVDQRKAILVENFHGADIGTTVTFEIHNGHFYSVSNQRTFEVEECDYTSFYHCIRYAIGQPIPTAIEKNERLYRRQHAEGPIHDSWADLSLQLDEFPNENVIVESRMGRLCDPAHTLVPCWIRGHSSSAAWLIDPLKIREQPDRSLVTAERDCLIAVDAANHHTRAHRLLPDPRVYHDSVPERSILDRFRHNHATQSSSFSSYFEWSCKLIASCRPYATTATVLLENLPKALATDGGHVPINDLSIFDQESLFDHMMTLLMIIYLLIVWKVGAKAKAYALAFMLAMTVLWLPLIGDGSGVRKTVFKVWAATTFHYVVQDCVDAKNSKMHVIQFLGLSILFLIVGASLQQFAADSVLNVLPPSLALAAVINWALPQPAPARPPLDEEAVPESLVDRSSNRPYRAASSPRLSRSSNSYSTMHSIHSDETRALHDNPIELVPSDGDRSDADVVPGDNSVTS